MIPASERVGVIDSSVSRGFGIAPFTQAVNASAASWPALIKNAMQATAPFSDVVVIAQNGNTSYDGLPDPDGEPGFNSTAAETYFGIPLTTLILQYDQVALTDAENITNFTAIEAYAQSLGSDVWFVTPHPCTAASGIDPLKLISLRNAVMAWRPNRYIDAWTNFVDGTGLYALSAYMLDDRHWNTAGHALFASIVTARTGLGA